MRQVCNVSYARQLDGLLELHEREQFVRELWAPPGRRVSYVSPELDALMAPPSQRRRP